MVSGMQQGSSIGFGPPPSRVHVRRGEFFSQCSEERLQVDLAGVGYAMSGSMFVQCPLAPTFPLVSVANGPLSNTNNDGITH
jgi:hypothetical protein